MTERPESFKLAGLRQALAALPDCPWLAANCGTQDWNQAIDESKDVRGFLLGFDAHAAACPTCQRRWELTNEMNGETGGWQWRILGTAHLWGYRQPDWLRPALAGAAVMGVMSLFRIVMLFAGMPVLMALLGFGLSVAIGFGAGLVGGNSYRILRPKADEWGPLGPYVAGLLFALILGLATSLVLWAIPDTSEGFREGWAWQVVGMICAIIGPILGFLWFRPGKEFKLL